MTNYKFGDVVLLPFPFTDLKTHKRRPALILAVISSETLPDLIIVAMVTSQIEGEMIRGDVLLKDWRGCGLIHPSKLRLAKIVSVETGIVLKKIGEMATLDARMVKKEIKKIFL